MDRCISLRYLVWPFRRDRVLEYLGEEQFGQIVAFLIVLIATLAAASMIRWGLGQLVTRSGLSSTDRILGFAFGAVRGGIVVTILLMVSRACFLTPGGGPIQS